MTPAQTPPKPETANDPRRLCAPIKSLVGALRGPREHIEAGFLDVGARLSGASGHLDRIVAAFAALPRDLDSAEMADAVARLNAIARRTREIAGAFASEREDIQRLMSTVEAASQPIVDLRRAVRLMGILAVNARIVAAGLADAADQFDVFTMDIATLFNSAVRVIEEFGEGHAKLAKAVRDAAEQFARFDDSHRGILTDLATKLDRSLAGVAERRAASAGRSAETARVSAGIAERVASAVMALQVGDSTRQRIEHAETALTDIAGWVAGRRVADLAIPSPARAGFAAIGLDLEEAQVAAAIAAFSDEVVAAEQTLVELAGDARRAIADSRQVYGAVGKATQTPIEALGAEMRYAANLLRDCATQRGKLDRMAGAVDETVAVLLGHVEAVAEIEANVRLVGLNAAVKCAQLGPRGASLSVIAQQLRELTSDLVPAARAAVSRLDEAAAAARAFGAASTARLAQEVTQLESEAVASIGLLESVDGKLRDALSTLEREGSAAAAELAQASTGLGDHAAIIEALEDARFGLAELSEAAASEEPVISPAERSAFDHLRHRYSMEAERHVHDEVLAALLPESATHPVQKGPSAAQEDLAEVLLF